MSDALDACKFVDYTTVRDMCLLYPTVSQGTADQVYSVKNAEEEIKLFTGVKDARLEVVEGGAHFLSFSHPEAVDKSVLEFVGKYS